jgi:hypothetical protein
MDPWLQDDIKELLAKPCLATAGMIGHRLDNRRRIGQEIAEPALTELFVDAFDTSSQFSAWGMVKSLLQDRNFFLTTKVRKSTVEHRTGADIGLILTRSIHQNHNRSQAQYAVLIQCKRIDRHGIVEDFYHVVKSTGMKQSSLLLDITPASFYFLYTPPSFIETYCSLEPLAFVQGAPGCSSPVWNMGCFGFEDRTFSFLTTDQKAEVTSILVVPAIAVEAQQSKGTRASIQELLPNAVPFWYWFSELFVPGFVGDYRHEVIAKAGNYGANENVAIDDFGVRFSIELSMGNG